MSAESGAGLARRTLASLRPEEVEGRRALVRVDFNVPLEGEGASRRVTSDTRIRGAVPTIRALLARSAVIILASHLGRPRGTRVPQLSLKPVAERLEALLERRIAFLAEPFDERSQRLVRDAQPGEIHLLENLRFEPGETANDAGFARRLAAFGELFVQDAFGTVHRAHASTVGVAEHLHPRVAGLLLERELASFRRLLESPQAPFVAVLGGAKIAGKLETVTGLARRCDRVCLGGGMANTFLAARGLEVGDSLVERDRIPEAEQLLAERPEALLLPEDVVVAREIGPDAEARVVPVDRVPVGWKILDIGPATVHAFGRVISSARTVFWNGPMGVFETPPFDAGTRAIAEHLTGATEAGAYTIAGGGDSVAALEQSGRAGAVSHVSTGGGAALELVTGAILPGVVVLDPAEVEPVAGGAR